MSSVILRTATRFLLPLLLLFSIFLLFRGHKEPGGGFAGALVAVGAFALVGMAAGGDAARRALRVRPSSLIRAGLLTALASGLWGAVAGGAFLEARWLELQVAGRLVELGTPILFDVGVYLTVLGAVLLVLLSLVER